MDVFLWLVFTSNLISQTTWLKVKLVTLKGNEQMTVSLKQCIQLTSVILTSWLFNSDIVPSTMSVKFKQRRQKRARSSKLEIALHIKYKPLCRQTST